MMGECAVRCVVLAILMCHCVNEAENTQTSSPDVVVQTSSPNVVVQTSSPYVLLQTSSPDVVVQTSSLDVVPQTSSPDVAVQTLSPDVAVQTSSPDVAVQTSSPNVLVQTPSRDVVVETPSTGSAVESASLDLSLMTSPIMSAYTSASIYPSPTSYDASSTVLPTTSLPPPSLTMDDVSVYQGGGDAVHLCHMDRDYTFSSVHFLKNNALLGQSPDISEDRTEFTYRISDPRCTDSGEYECRVVGEEGNLTTAANLTVLGKPTLTLPFEIVEGRWKETSLFVCSYRQGIPSAEVYWSATLANGTTLDRLNFITQESVAESQTDACTLEATSQFYYGFSMAWNASSVCCNVKEGANARTACGDVYVIPSDTCMNQTGKFEHPYTCQLWIECVSDVVYIGRCPKGHCIDLQNDLCVSGPRDGPTVANTQGPKCEPQVNVSMTRTQQLSGDPIYCVNSTTPTCNDSTYDLNYTIVSSNFNIMELDGPCLMLLKAEFTQSRYCITIFATQIIAKNPLHDDFEICVTFNEAPVFGSDLIPNIIIVPLLTQPKTIDIPVDTSPDGILAIQLSDVTPRTMVSAFSIADDNSVINYTRPADLTGLASVTSVDLTVNVTDDGNPPLSAQKVFTLLLVNDFVTCYDFPSIINVDTTVPLPAVKPLSCTSAAGNSLSYNVTVLSGADFAMSVLRNGSISINTSSQVADSIVNVEVSSIYSVQTSFNTTISAGEKPNCSVASSDLNVRTKDAAGSIYINFTCETAGSNKDAMEFDIDNDIEDDFFAVSATSRDVGGTTVGSAGISLAAAYNETTFPSSVTVTVTNVYGDTKLTFKVVIVNTPPVFVPSDLPVVTVSEKLTSGGQVYTISATDEESSVTFSVQDAMNSSIPVPFSIDPSTGQISTSGSLNATLVKSYTVTITVTDAGGLSSSINMTINVDDVNEPPQCANSGDVTLNVDVTAPVNYSVIVLNCYDWDVADNNSILTYTLEGVEAQLAGHIGFNDSNNREILLLQSLSTLNLTATPSTTFNIIIADGGTPSLNLTLSITINFSDKRPTCSEPSLQLSVSERSAVSSCFNLTHSCTDPTSTGLTYVLTNTSLGGGDQPLLAFFSLGTNSQGSQLPYLTVCLETNITGLPGRYMGGLQVSNNLFSTNLNVTVEVLDVNDLPIIQGLPINNTYNISETSPIGLPVATLNISDPDPGNNGVLSVTFEAADPSLTYAGDFEFNNVTEEIKVAQMLNATRNTDYSYILTVTDGGGLSTSVNIIINVDDVNEAPKCEQPGDFTVNATAGPDFVIGQLICWDTDAKTEFKTLVYEAKPKEPGATSLIYVKSDGVIKLLDTIPYQHDQLVYLVTVSNGSPGNTIAPSVTIPVTIVYNKAFPPTCNTTSVSVRFKDTDSVGCAVEKVKCTNPLDKLPSVQMTSLPANFILEQEETGASISFRMCANNTSFKDSIGSHEVKVIVENGLGNVTMTWNIVVEDVNEAPRFQEVKYHGSIPETTPIGKIIAMLQISNGPFTERDLKATDGTDIIRVTDPDRHTVQHQIQRTAAHGKIVWKRNNTAVAADNLPIDYSFSNFSVRGDLDESLQYQFTIQVVDGGNLSASVVYTVDILDVNEAPTCSVSSLIFNMGLVTDVDTVMDTLSCSDPDYDANKTKTVYTMEGPDREFFNISSSGAITLGKRLPRDRDTLQLQAVASDAADSSLKHVVDITVNVNRTVSAKCELRQINPPVWIINSCISLNVTCTDPTADATSTLTYTESGTYTGGFTLVGDAGLYTLCYTLTTNGTYYIEITVDNGLKNTSLRSDIGVVYLRSTPTFENQKYEVNVTKTVAVGDTFLTVKAATGGNFSGNITYQITDYTPPSVSSFFQVKPVTGELQVLKDLEELLRNRIFDVTLTVQATDDLSLLKSTVGIKVIIQEVNLLPNCDSVPNELKVDLSIPVGDEIYQVVCTDANFRPTLNQVSYTMQVSDDYFALDSEGRITVKQSLSLTKSTYALRIGITDGHSNQQVTVVISVTLTQDFTVELVNITTTSIQIQWSFKRADYAQIVNHFIVEFQGGDKQGVPMRVEGDLQGTVLTGLAPGTTHVIAVKADTIFGTARSNTLTTKTKDIPVLSKMNVRYKDKNTQWTAGYNNPNSMAFRNYAITAEDSLKEGLKAVDGLHAVTVIGLSSGSVMVDALVAVNQSGNITQAKREFQDAVYSGKLGTHVDRGSAEVKNGDKYAVINSMTLGSGVTTAVSEDGNASVQCVFRLVGASLTPSVRWTLNDKAISATSSGKYTTNITKLDTDVFGYVAKLDIVSVGIQDNGTYKCELASDDILEHRSLPVLVLQKPIVALQPLTNFVKSRDAVELNCSMLSGQVDAVVFTWYRDNELISNPPVVDVSPTKQTLKIQSALSNSAFSCQVTNTGGSTTSPTATIRIIKSDVKTCNQSSDSQGTVWMPSPVGQTITMNCPPGYQGLVQRVCGSAGQWQRANYADCRLGTLVELQEQLDTLQTGLEITNTEAVVSQLKDVTGSNPLVAGDVDTSINIINQIVSISENRTEVKKELVKDVVESASNVLQADKTVWEDLDKENKQGVTSLLKTLDNVGQVASQKSNTSSNDESLTIITTKSIVLAFGKTNPKDITFPQANSGQYPAWVQTSKTKVTIKAQTYSASVPANNLMGYSGVLYKDIEELVSRRKAETDGSTIQDVGSVPLEKKINSRILSFSLIPSMTTKLNPSVTLSFEHLNGNFSEPVCGFLNYSAPYEQNGRWSSEGCRVVNNTENMTVCDCDHLTNFAILMSPGRITEQDAKILSIISAVGCGISIFFLVLTICIYCALWRYVKSDRAIILINLCFALIIAYSIFLGGVTQTENQAVCTAISALLHFFFLVVFFLMLAEGVEVLVSVIYVFNTKSRLRWLLLLSWGAPVVVVGISLGATQLNGYGSEQFCWLSLESGLLWAFVAPALAVILANLIIVFIVLKTMFSTTAMMTKSAMEKGRAGLKALCVLLPLMGVTWVFGVFSVNEDLRVFQYLFAVFNSLQGFFIFIFHCLVSRQIQDGMKNRWRRYRAQSFKTTGTESLSQMPASKLVSTSSEEERPINDLDKKVGSPFIEADRQVQQIAKKLYANHDNLMDNNNPQKPSNKVNVPVDPSDIKLMNGDNTLDSFLFTNIDNHKPVIKGGWMKEDIQTPGKAPLKKSVVSVKGTLPPLIVKGPLRRVTNNPQCPAVEHDDNSIRTPPARIIKDGWFKDQGHIVSQIPFRQESEASPVRTTPAKVVKIGTVKKDVKSLCPVPITKDNDNHSSKTPLIRAVSGDWVRHSLQPVSQEHITEEEEDVDEEDDAFIIESTRVFSSSWMTGSLLKHPGLEEELQEKSVPSVPGRVVNGGWMKEGHNSVREKPVMEDSGPAIVKTPLARVFNGGWMTEGIKLPSQGPIIEETDVLIVPLRAVSGKSLKQDQHLTSKDDIIEENESLFIETHPPKSPTAMAPSPIKKNAWGEQSSPLHFSDYKLGGEKQQAKKSGGQLPPVKTRSKPLGLLDHYDAPPAHILADPRIQDRDPDPEGKLQERKKRLEQVYSVEPAWSGEQNKARKPVSSKTSGQSQKSSNNSQRFGDDPQSMDHEFETIHLYESRDLPLYRGRADDNWGKVKTAVERKKRQQRNSGELPRHFVNSEEDLSRYGSRQPFGGIRTTDVGVPIMSRPRQHREDSRHDPNRHYRYM